MNGKINYEAQETTGRRDERYQREKMKISKIHFETMEENLHYISAKCSRGRNRTLQSDNSTEESVL